MAEHDFRTHLLSTQHTLIECRAVKPGLYQLTGLGGQVRSGDSLLVTLRGSQDLSMTLTVDKVRHLINPPGQWTATASGPLFKELSIHRWQVHCNACNQAMEFEFAYDAALGEATREAAATARIEELGWRSQGARHLCPNCQKESV